MNSKIILYPFIFIVLFFLGYNLHSFFLEKLTILLPYNLQKIYLFNAGFSAIVCVNFVLLSSVDKVYQQLGFIYLGTLFLKILLFCGFFYKSLFAEESLTNQEAISLLIPIFVFLLTEVIIVIKMIHKNHL